MEFYYQIRENGIPFGRYFNGMTPYANDWLPIEGRRIYHNISACCQDANILSEKKSVVVVKRMKLPNGKWKELPIKVFKKK